MQVKGWIHEMPERNQLTAWCAWWWRAGATPCCATWCLATKRYCNSLLFLFFTVLGIRIRMFLGLKDPDPFVRGAEPDPAPDPSFSHKYVERTEIILNQNRTLTLKFAKIKFFRLKITWLWASYKKKIWKKNIIFASCKSMKKKVGSGVGSGSGSISQRQGSGDPDSHQNVTELGFLSV